MKTRLALLAASVAVLSACGEEFLTNPDAGPVYHSFSSGTYAVSNAVLTSATDQCGLLGAYTAPDKKIGITASGNNLTFNLANDNSAAADSLPKAVLNGNTIEQPTEANYTVAYTNPSCVVRIKRNVVGDLTANETASLKLSFDVTWDAQGTCTASNTSFSAVPCSSSYQFTATRQ